MTGYLLRKIEKKVTGKDDQRLIVGGYASLIGILCNVVLFVLKLTIGLLSGSIAIIADALNNLSDAASSLVTLIGFRLSRKPADRNHPFGHARIEYMTGAFTAIAIILVGVELLKTSIERIGDPTLVDYTVMTLILLVLTILVKLWMRSFYRTLGQKIESTALAISSQDSRNDAISTTAVLLGVLVHRIWQLNIDGWIGSAVAFFILISGILSVRDTLSPLLGEAPPKILVDKLCTLISSAHGVEGLHDLIVHSYGPNRYFATVHVEMAARESPLLSHGTIDDLERTVEEKLGIKLVIHYDPLEPPDEETAMLEGRIREFLAEIDTRLSIHDLRLIRAATHTNVVFDVGVPPDYSADTTVLSEHVTNSIRSMDPHYRTVIEIDRNYTALSK